ncbi:MAG: histidine kinase [Flavobacteriaceae bacterium]|nr:histidine kinase [Flavobacteriaceae bacterium]
MISVLKQNKWLLVKVCVIVTILVPLTILGYEFLVLGNDSVVFLESYPAGIGIIIVIYYAIILIMIGIWLLKQLHSILSLKNELIKNELLNLQSQVNPHFFFNMLNNLYGMVDKDAEKSKALILKLSDLMRYSIYEGEKNRVSIFEEVSYLKNYIELHKMRYHKKIHVQFETDIIDENLKIMPLLLINLLENAFKHGVENLRKNAYVAIHLKTSKDMLFFTIENNFDENEVSKHKGIGLKNLKRRLALAYPKKHKFTIEAYNSVYKAQLELLIL